MTINAHPELPAFEYILPATLVEASQFLAAHSGEARPLSGGTDIFVRMRDGLWHDKYLVDVKHLDGTSRISFDPSSGLTIGAGVNMNQVIACPEVQTMYPLLAQACRTVASYQLRTRATVVGNICNASPAGDTIGACLVLDGKLSIHGIEGYGEVSIKSFFLGPGKTVLKPGDIVTAIHFPLPPEKNAGVYLKLGRNTWSDLSIVGVTAYAYQDPRQTSGYHFQVALASVAPVPLLLPAVEEHLGKNEISVETLKEAARIAEAACAPINDVRGSARYRKAMVRNLTARALEQVRIDLSSKG
jgi:CO/xanthine dehydrogenase FAD-binding subunit